VYNVPDGSEEGNFLAVDLGGTNCRICLVDLLGNSTYKVMQTKQTVPKHLRINPRYAPLFSFIAKAILDFLNQYGLQTTVDCDPEAESIPLGFTFSFTCEQTSISKGTLIQWDKGWDIPEAVGRDPCAMLQESIDEMKLPVQVSALANDSVGTLLSRAYTSQEHGSTLASVIVGTGTNAAYIERLSNVPRLTIHNTKHIHEAIVINTEWGCFDDKLQVLPTTIFDRVLDAGSINPGSQQLEKRVSGLYLGELMRLVILHCQDLGIFNMNLEDASPCSRQYGLDSSFLSLLAKDETAGSLDVAKAIEQELSARSVTANDARILKQLADSIVKRSARLAGSALGAIIIQSGRLSAPQSEKRTVQVSSKRTQQDSTQGSSHRRRNCGPFGRIVEYCKRLATSPKNSQPAVENRLGSHLEGDIIDIGVDGSLIELYPGFETHIRSALRDVQKIGSQGEKKVKMGLARDGSGVGAALMANAARLI
jgi:hexokinase